MDIIISVDKNYLGKAETMLFSLYKNSGETADVWLLYSSLTDKETADFSKYIDKKCKGKIAVHPIKVNEADFSSLKVISYFSVEMYYRALAPFLLPETVERALYLDADMIILKNLSPLYDTPLGNAYAAVCADFSAGSEEIARHKKEIGVDDGHIYFNSGVLLLNLKAIRRDMTADDVFAAAEKLGKKLLYPDQDVLNALYSGKVIYADGEIWNYQKLKKRYAPLKRSVKNKIAIIHYVGERKPWKFWAIDAVSGYYWRTEIARGYLFKAAAAYIFFPFAFIIHGLKKLK